MRSKVVRRGQQWVLQRGQKSWAAGDGGVKGRYYEGCADDQVTINDDEAGRVSRQLGFAVGGDV